MGRARGGRGVAWGSGDRHPRGLRAAQPGLPGRSGAAFAGLIRGALNSGDGAGGEPWAGEEGVCHGTWFSGELGGAGLAVGLGRRTQLDDVKGLF